MPLHHDCAAPMRLSWTEDIAERIMTLPIGASMTVEDAD
jgi:hypothetical protein